MSDERDFDFYCGEDRIKVRFVSAKKLGRDNEGHQTYGDFGDRKIRLARWELRRSQQITFLHEFGHYVYQRMELQQDSSEEVTCDMLCWVGEIIGDPRNELLRAFLLEPRPS